MKVATVVGARPQFIKAAVVSRVLRKNGGFEEVLIHTGQHYDASMSEVFFDELEIPEPEYNLAVGSGRHGEQTGRMLETIEEVLLSERPEWCIVCGDTNSTLAGALAAVKLHIPVAHIEAGLRSFDRRMPEEVNRILADHISQLLFVPTETAWKNLEREGIPEAFIHVVGDVMYDAALYYGSRAEAQSSVLRLLGLSSKQYVLATLHRAENTDDAQRLRTILVGLAALSSEIPVVWPIHPRTRKALGELGAREATCGNIVLIEPVGYLDMIMLEKHAKMIATDSGGVQKEAFFHGVPCATVREATEWLELIDLGWNRLVPPVSVAAIEAGLRDALTSSPARKSNPYGDGHAGEHIVRILANLQTSTAIPSLGYPDESMETVRHE